MILTAQILKERRVYYLDCSYSMKTNGVWDKVRDNLIHAIENVSDETTELVVIPFACDNGGNLGSIMINKADETGKRSLINGIEKLSLNKKTMTYHDVPLDDFNTKRTATNRVT